MSLAEAASTLAGHLHDSAPLWRPAPFHGDPRWVNEHPALAGALLALPDPAVDALDDDADALEALLTPHISGVRAAREATAACVDPDPPPPPLPGREAEARDVPGRKWKQLRHFGAACGTPAGPVLEWCSGKAHLGRLLARTHGCTVTSLEWNATLCTDGARLAARERLPVHVRQQDVRSIAAGDPLLRASRHAVALHACGDLHVALLRAGGATLLPALDIAPCCYHLTQEARWQPLSAVLAAHPLNALSLTRDDLRLAVQETKTASARAVSAQHTLAAWRLAFDVLQRELRGIDAYLPTPPRPARVIAGGFPAFCASLAAHQGLALPDGIDYAVLERTGRERLARVRRLELLRHAFRRPLEILLVADRALYLAGHGYDVRVRTFCPRDLTPRNLLVQARHPSATRCGGTGGSLALAR